MVSALPSLRKRQSLVFELLQVVTPDSKGLERGVGFGSGQVEGGHSSRFGVRISSAVPESYTLCRHAQPS
jgi:hypothetical protein